MSGDFHCTRMHFPLEGKDKRQATAEPSQETMSHDFHHTRDKTGPQEEDSTEIPQYPPKYHVFLHFLQVALELFLLVIGIGYFPVHKIKAMKQKHKLTYQIMKKLVRGTELWRYGGTGSRPYTSGGKKMSLLPSNTPDDHVTTEDQDEIRQDDSASTSNNPPRLDGFKDGKKWKEMVEPIRKLNDLVEKIVSGLLGKEVFLEVEKKWSDVYRFKMPKDSVKGGKGSISPILVAAKNGVVEMVEEILNVYSLAIYDEDAEKKNVLMLAVEQRRLDIYNILRQRHQHKSIIFQKLDKDGNSAIHLAATTVQNQPWPIPGAALQMQWELKWYKFVRETMPHNIFRAHRNEEGMTSKEVFDEAHKTMLKDGVQWLTNTAQSCSVVAALIATVAYAAATTVPGGVEKGIPLLRNTYAFSIFTIASLVAVCLSVTSLTMFLSILTSRNEIGDFQHNLPIKAIMGLTSLFISIAAMLVSFCAGHFFDLADQLQHTAFPIYAVTCLPVSIYAATQFPLYFDLIYSIIMPVPKRSN